MTMPNERTRSLRWGWEFLLELRATPNLDDDQRRQVDVILKAYPSGSEIEARALLESTRRGDLDWARRMLAPENKPFDAHTASNPGDPERGQITPAERTRALRLASEFVIDLGSAANLSSLQKRQIPYILRHFPNAHEIESWARLDAAMSGRDPKFTAWLAPEQDLAP